MDEISQNSPKEQQLAAPFTFLFLSNQEKFVYQKYDFLPSGYLIINSIFNDKATSFLPVLHDYQIKSNTYTEFVDCFKDRQKYIALSASDGSVILYQISEADI